MRKTIVTIILVNVLALGFIAYYVAGSLQAMRLHSWRSIPSPEDICKMVEEFSGDFVPQDNSGEADDVHSMPHVELRRNGTFLMTAIPSNWMKNWPESTNSPHSLSGNWIPDDDGDGSWIIQMHITLIDGVSVNRVIRARPGAAIIYDIDAAGHSNFPNQLHRVPIGTTRESPATTATGPALHK